MSDLRQRNVAPKSPAQPATAPKSTKISIPHPSLGVYAAVLVPMTLITLLSLDVGELYSSRLGPALLTAGSTLPAYSLAAYALRAHFPTCGILLFADSDLVKSLGVSCCLRFIQCITLAAWITHVLEGVVCFFVAMAYGISGVTSFIDASLVGAAGTAILFKKLNIARPGVVIPACLTAFAVIAFITHRIMV